METRGCFTLTGGKWRRYDRSGVRARTVRRRRRKRRNLKKSRLIRLNGKVQKVIVLDHDEILAFCGEHDRKLKKIQSKLSAKIIPRGNEIHISGGDKEVETAHRIIADLLAVQRDGQTVLTDRQLHHALDEGTGGKPAEVKAILGETIRTMFKGKTLTPLTEAQRHYVAAIREKDIVFCVGPAGTGKTYLSMALAVESLASGQIQRLVLVRPVVEAGERLGFLPGDIAQKFDPYVRPLYDALYDMMEADKARELIENETIEIAPLAFMRGRTLSNSFVILDEAQNTSIEQMKMFLTRMGDGSKVVVTGDVTQIDLPKNRPSGLVHAVKLLKGIEGIAFVKFTRRDVVRHELVQKIVTAYEAQGKK